MQSDAKQRDKFLWDCLTLLYTVQQIIGRKYNNLPYLTIALVNCYVYVLMFVASQIAGAM